MRLTFLGAAHEVTGSCTLLSGVRHEVLVDCGLFQGAEYIDPHNQVPFSFDIKNLTAVVITHAHLDHVGRLPLLIKAGYGGLIYATPATIELLELILQDAWEVMRYNHEKFGSPMLYDQSDIGAVREQCRALDYYVPTSVSNDGEVVVTLYDSGHILVRHL